MRSGWVWREDTPPSYCEEGEGHLGAIVMHDGEVICDFGFYMSYEHLPGTPPDEQDRALLLASPTMLSAIEQFEAWWIADGQNHFNGAPACVFALRAAAAMARDES